METQKMSSQLGVKRRFIDGRNDWRFQTEKAPVNTSGSQFIQGEKLFNDPITFYNDVICHGKYKGDGSLLTNVSVQDTSKLPLAGGTMTGPIILTDISAPDVTTTINAGSYTVLHTNGQFNTINLNYATIMEPGGVEYTTCSSTYVTANNNDYYSFLRPNQLQMYDNINSREIILDPTGVAYNAPAVSFSTKWPDIINSVNPNLDLVLDNGPTALGKNMVLNGAGNYILLDDLVGNTNTINANGYSTKNASSSLATHYLNFSDNYTSGIGPIQKSSQLSCVPSSGIISATQFNGLASNAAAINTTTYNTNTTCYIPFTTSTAGNQKILYVDDASGPLTYNPGLSTLSATTFVGALTGTASAASTITTTSDNNNVICYPVFTKLTGGTGRALYQDDTSGPLTYNPFLGTLTATTFAGALTGTATNATNIATTLSTTNSNFYLTFVASNANSSGQAANVATAIKANPGTGDVSATSFTTTSDYRIKEDVQDLQVSIDDLKPKRYYNRLSRRYEFGFIAHEVQETLSDLVCGQKDADEYQSIHYQQIIPLLVYEIQELKKRLHN